MAAACNTLGTDSAVAEQISTERWVLQRNRLFACLFRVLERPEPMLRLPAARAVLRLLSAGRATATPELQLPKYEAAVCKVLFQLTRASTNDDAFFEASVVDPMLALLEAQTSLLAGSDSYTRGGGRSAGSTTSPTASLPVDAPVYLAGAVKNLSSGSEAAQHRLGQLGAIAVLCGLLKASAGLEPTTASKGGRSAEEEKGGEEKTAHNGGGGGSGSNNPHLGAVSEKQQAQLLIQITGALRNLSVDKAHYRQLSACGAPAALCSLVKPFTQHKEVMFNVARVLAKLSLHEPLRAGINSKPTHLRDLLTLMDVTAKAIPSTDVPTTPPRAKGTNAANDVLASSSLPRISSEALDALQQPTALLVRVAFTLGNLTASNDRNRALIGSFSDGGRNLVEIVCVVHRYYVRLSMAVAEEAQIEAQLRERGDEEGEGKEGDEGEGKEADRGEGKEADEGPRRGRRSSSKSKGEKDSVSQAFVIPPCPSCPPAHRPHHAYHAHYSDHPNRFTALTRTQR